MADFKRELTKFERDLDALLSLKVIHKHLAAKYGKGIVHAVIAAAKGGYGLNKTGYPPYSPKYAEKKAAAGVDPSRNWLRGIGKQGRYGGMLDAKNFVFEIDGIGKLWLTFVPTNARMAIYSEVHQLGLPLGKNGPSKPRPFLHTENVNIQAAIRKAYRQTLDDLIGTFNAGRTPT